MPCHKHKELLERWWNDRLTEAERAGLEAKLSECEDCRRELEGSRELWSLMSYVPVPEPSEEMEVQFNAMLEGYKEESEAGKERRTGMAAIIQLFAMRPAVAAVFCAVLLLGGFGLGMMINRQKTVVVQGPVVARGSGGQAVADGSGGQVTDAPAVADGSGRPARVSKQVDSFQAGRETVIPARDVAAVSGKSSAESKQLEALTAQVHEMRELMMLSLLQNPAASERIRAVSYTSEIRHVNPKISAALLTTLNNDPNVNVRLMTLEALTHFAGDPVVREGLIQSILQQDSPNVQAALADIMLKLQEKRAIQPLKKLLQQKDLNGMVRSKIEETITRLT